MNAIVPESWRFLRLAAGYCKQFPHAKQARKKKCVNEKGRGNQTLVIQIDVFCDQRRWFLPGTGSTTKLSSGGPQTCSHPWSIIYCIHWYYIDSTLIVHWYYIDITLILHWYYIDITLILHWYYIDQLYGQHTMQICSIAMLMSLYDMFWIHRKRYIHTLWPYGNQ